MFNFSGIIYRIFGVCGAIFILGIIYILLNKPWSQNFKIQNCKLSIISIALAVCLSLLYISRIIFPAVSSYTGEFIDHHRNSRVAPPLPVTYEYVFGNDEDKKHVFYLDVFSKEKIYPSEFEHGCKYTIYFDKLTKVIVAVKVIP